MALRARATTVDYFAYNTSNGVPAVGDGSNHTVYILVDNNTPVQYTGTITEVDSTNLPGLYRISLTSDHTDGYKITVYVKSSTSNVLIHPVEFFTEDGRLDAAVSSRLPNGNVTVGGYASGMSPAEQVLSTPANKLLTNSNGHVTVAVNNDKSGYSLQTSEHTAIASSVWSATTRTLSSLGNSLVDEIWHRLRSASDPPAGSFGYYLDAQVSSVGGGAGGTSDWTTAEKEQIRYVLGIDGTKTAPTGNTGWIPDIRSKTQQLTFTGSNVNANVSSYSNGLSPGEQVLATPSIKIVTDSGGNVLISNTQADSISSTAASLVWLMAVTSLTGANTIGKRIVDYLDTTVSSRSTLSVSDVQTALTNQGYTTARASKLDNLDVAVSSRLASADYTAPPGTASIANAVWSHTTRELTALSSSVALSIWHVPATSITAAGTVGLQVKNNLDAAVSTRSILTTGDVRSSATQALTDLGYTSTRAARLDNLDVTVSSRLAQSSYVVPPDTSDIATAVWSHSSRVITGMDPAAAVTVWNVPTTSVTANGSIGLQVKTNIDATISSRSTLTTGDVKSASQQALTDQGYTSARAGYLDRLDVAVSTRLAAADYSTASIAGAVWSYSTRELTAISTGLAVSVWNVPTANVTASNSIGLRLRDNIDAAISTRLAASSYVAPPTPYDIASAVWTYGTRQITDMNATAALAVWHTPAANVTAANTIGLQIKTNIDAAISSRSTLTAGDVRSAAQQALTDQGYTTTRAAKLDHLDGSVTGSVSSVWSTQVTALTGDGTIGKYLVTYLDTPVSNAATPVDVSNVVASTPVVLHSSNFSTLVSAVTSGMTSQGYTVDRASNLDHLDVSVSSRLEASSYVAPPTTGQIASAVWTYSDRQLTAVSTGLALSVWHVPTTSITGADTIGLQVKTNVDATISSRSTLTSGQVQTVLDNQGYTFARAAKLDNLDVAVSSRLASADYSAAAIASAVWGHSTRELTAISTGLALSVWHVPTTSVTAANTVGLQLKTNIDATISSRSTLTAADVRTASMAALTDQGYTTTRAAKLDNLDVAVSSRLAASSYVAPPGTSDIAAAVWTYTTRQITDMATGAALAVWHTPTTSVTAANTVGLQIKTNLDTTVSSRSTLDQSGVQSAMVNLGYTAGRAVKLDNLDVAISSRLASSDYSTASIANAVWSYANRELTSLSTGLAVSVWHVPANSVTASNTIGLQLKQNVDAAISSRLAASSYVAPDNTGISNIWNKVQNLSYTQQGSTYYVNAYTTNPGSVDYNQVATSVWSAATSSDYGAGSFGNLVKANVDAPISSRLASGDYVVPPAATAVASAVWSYSTRELTAIPSSQAVAVWNVAATALTGTGTVGKRVVDNIDVPISSRSTLTASDVWAYSTRELTAISTGLAVSVWNVPSANVSAANSIGLHIKGSIDVPVSTRLAASAYVAPDNATISSIWSKVQNLSYTQQGSDYYVNAYTTNPGTIDYNQVATSVWSAASGTNYGSGAMGTLIKSNLDAAVSSRLAASSYTAPPTTSDIAAAVWGYSNRQITDMSSTAALAVWHVPAVSITAANTIGLQLKTNVDAAISTRLSASSYVAPDNTTIANIWSKVQNLSYTQQGSNYYVNTYTINPGSIDYDQVAASVWSAATSSSYGDGSFGELVKTNIDAAISSRLASSGYTTPPTTAAIASAVWTHPDRQLTQISPSVAVGVWNVATTSLTGVGTIGQQLKNNVDVAVSTRSTLTFSDVQSAVSDIGYTAARAAKLDYLDATISSRSTLTADQVWTYGDRQLTALSTGLAMSVWDVPTSSATGIDTIGKRVVDNLDVAVSSRSALDASGVLNALNAQGYTSARASRLDNLDATVSSRLATAAFSPTGIAEAVWNTQRGTSRAYDTFGFYLDARVSSISEGGGGGFYGPFDVTLQFLDDNNNPVSGVVFFVEGMGGAMAPGGSITINLPGGNFIVRAMGAGSVMFAPTAISVTGSGSFQIRGARVSVPVATNRNGVVLHYLLSDDRGNPLPNTDLTVTILDLPVGADRSIWNVGQTWTVRSNSNGVAVLPELPVSALVELTATVGTRQVRVTLRVPRMEQ